MKEQIAELINAIADNQLQKVEDFIRNGIDVNKKKSNKDWSALHWACFKGNDKIAKLLLEHGASIDENQNKNQVTSLHLCKNIQTAQVLLDYGASVNSVDKSGFSVLQTIINEYTRSEEEGEISELCNFLIEKGADTNHFIPKKFSVLNTAIEYKLPKVVEAIVKKGANLEFENKSIGMPVHHALHKKSPEILEILLKNGANVNAIRKSDGWTPLFYASFKKLDEICTLLLSYGADKNIIDKYGKKAYEYAKAEELKNLLQP